MDIRVDITERDDWSVVAVHGEVDIYTAPVLREHLLDLVTQGKTRLVVDLQGVEFLDSTGLGVLVGSLKRVKEGGGELLIVCSQGKILRLFEITGLTRVFSIHDTVDEAVAA